MEEASDTGHKTEYVWGIPVETNEKEYKTGYLIGAIAAGATAIISVIIAEGADTQVKLLEIEGQKKGYITTGIKPTSGGAIIMLSYRF